MAKFKVGDKVRVRSDRGRNFTCSGNMDIYLGTEQVIHGYNDYYGTYELENCFCDKDTQEYLVFDEEDLTLIEETDCIKDCENCKHFELDYDDFPCCDCGYYENYERCDEPSDDKDLKPKNYIAEFMKDNGIEPCQKFKIKGFNHIYFFNKEYILCKEGYFLDDHILTELICGKCEIIKIESEIDSTFVGKEIEVCDSERDDVTWKKRLLLAVHNGKFYCENINDSNSKTLWGWEYAREIKGN